MLRLETRVHDIIINLCKTPLLCNGQGSTDGNMREREGGVRGGNVTTLVAIGTIHVLLISVGSHSVMASLSYSTICPT